MGVCMYVNLSNQPTSRGVTLSLRPSGGLLSISQDLYQHAVLLQHPQNWRREVTTAEKPDAAARGGPPRVGGRPEHN